MDLKQRIVVWTGLALIVAMTVYPPWIQSFKPSVEVADGVEFRIEPGASCYHWIFSPPGPPRWFWSFQDSQILRLFWTSQLDVARLLVQWAAVVIVVLGLNVTFRASSR